MQGTEISQDFILYECDKSAIQKYEKMKCPNHTHPSLVLKKILKNDNLCEKK